MKTIPDFSSVIMQAKREYSKILKMLKEKYTNLKFYIKSKLSFKSKGKIKTLSNTT